MTNARIDNTISTQNVILWQYDNAERFCALVKKIEGYFKGATEAFWGFFTEHAHGIFILVGLDEDEDGYGLALWGGLIGMARPEVTLTIEGEDVTAPLSAELYRRVLKARTRLLSTNGSLCDISRYCTEIFGEGKVEVADGLDMSISYATTGEDPFEGDAELEALYEQLPDFWQFYPAGVRDKVIPTAKFFAFREQVVADTDKKITSATYGTSVYHPAPRKWSFRDDNGNVLVGDYSMSYADGVWTVTHGEGAEAKSASRAGDSLSIWHDIGVFFPMGCGTDGVFPESGLYAVYS